jgi:hypothetical protein
MTAAGWPAVGRDPCPVGLAHLPVHRSADPGFAARMKDKAEHSAFFGWGYIRNFNLMVEDRHE